MSQEKIIFSMAGVSKKYPPNKQILKNIYLSFFYGAKIGVIGLNGAGKSTLLRIIAGIDKNYEGEVVFSPGYTVGYLEQEPQLDPEKTVRQIVEEGAAETVRLLKEFEEINLAFSDPDVLEDPDKMEKLIERQATVQEKLDALNAWELDTVLEKAMDALRTPPEDAKIGTLSGGEKRRVALCRLLLQAPDVLLLDEPTNHLDAESVHWLEHHLRGYKGTVIIVTHDRYFLDNVTSWILELDNGQGVPWKANYSEWLEQKQQKLATQDKTASRFQKTLEKELEWVRAGAKGRQAKQKARLNAYERMVSEDNNQKEEKLEIFIPSGERLGDVVIEANDVSKAYGDRLLYENLTFSLPKNGIVGVIGPNGAGKTTLFRLILGQENADKGSFKIGQTVKIAYADQEHRHLEPERTIWETISGGNDLMLLGKKEVNSRAYVSRFNFNGADQQKKIKDLSGGERNRVHLALMLKEGGNLLLLDEPTNDLDVNTLRALEEGLENFAGCAVVISHDRWFLDRIATHILAFEGNSQVRFYEGNFSDYMEDRKKRLGDEIPKRIKYKKLG
ncbi:energy-dependent translational throttle protein EttA [Hugenholtzia roseola]|uniref:energy-dependent translational throttle protein EttA n=1 Tax=Hugenholtzia roseola TaxID=1002 RepID=UPI0004160391|nr:energy-dependent translational throttle protein EttA [Hugenholtzia roseola]